MIDITAENKKDMSFAEIEQFFEPLEEIELETQSADASRHLRLTKSAILRYVSTQKSFMIIHSLECIG